MWKSHEDHFTPTFILPVKGEETLCFDYGFPLPWRAGMRGRGIETARFEPESKLRCPAPTHQIVLEGISGTRRLPSIVGASARRVIPTYRLKIPFPKVLTPDHKKAIWPPNPWKFGPVVVTQLQALGPARPHCRS
jgi:hypothetical protein